MHRGALALLLVLPFLFPAARAAPSEFTFDLVATEDAQGIPVFLGSGATDPTLFATPGAHVTIHLVNQGKLAHNIVLGAPVALSTACCLRTGESSNLSFDLPSDFTGDISYQCSLHGGGGMGGILRVGQPEPMVRIVEPANATTIHGEVLVRVVAENATTAGPGAATLRYQLDGAPLNASSSTFSLGTPTKGNHLLQVTLVAPNGTLLAGTEAIFYEDPSPAPTAATQDVTSTSPPSTVASSNTPGAPLALALLVGMGVALVLRRSR